MKMNKVIGSVVVGMLISSVSIGVFCLNNNYKNKIEEINNEHERIVKEYEKEVDKNEEIILDLKNDIVELKNKEDKKYREFKHPNEVELQAGNYIVGEDVKEGLYDIIHVEGQGLVGINNEIWYQIGTNKDWGDTEEVKNIELKEGDKIEVTSGLTFRFIPIE